MFLKTVNSTLRGIHTTGNCSDRTFHCAVYSRCCYIIHRRSINAAQNINCRFCTCKTAGDRSCITLNCCSCTRCFADCICCFTHLIRYGIICRCLNGICCLHCLCKTACDLLCFGVFTFAASCHASKKLCKLFSNRLCLCNACRICFYAVCKLCCSLCISTYTVCICVDLCNCIGKFSYH